MGKKKRPAIPSEQFLSLPLHPRLSKNPPPIVDTHTHVLSTYAQYRSVYPLAKFEDLFAFVRGLYCSSPDASSSTEAAHTTHAIVDVWCEAPVTKSWREIADTALSESDRREKWGGINYWFVMGVHPHEAKHYNDEIEREILLAMSHPRCVGWGEIGLDYHYDNSPRDIQRTVLIRQLRAAVQAGKPVTIHTREAEEDTERILKAEVPRDYRIHVHCFTDSPEFATRLLDHFPNLYIGITGVITYSSNVNTSTIIRNMIASHPSSLRILLETDAPYMVPSNVYENIKSLPPGAKLPLCHTGMIPWTAEFVAKIAAEESAKIENSEIPVWDTERVMQEARVNASRVYGV